MADDRSAFFLGYNGINSLKKEKKEMIGALLGDMIGAPYEFDMGDKTKD